MNTSILVCLSVLMIAIVGYIYFEFIEKKDK